MKNRPSTQSSAPLLAGGSASIEIRLLGGFELRCRGAVMEALDSTIARALIAYLACHPDRVLDREMVASLLWPEVTETTARHNLRQALYGLRRAFALADAGDIPIEATRSTLGLASGSTIWVDVRAFGEAVSRGQREDGSIEPAQLSRAAQLYRGDLLAGFYLRESPDFEEWLMAEQERLKEDALAALRRLVGHHLETGSYAVGMQCARQLLRIDSFAEEAHRNLMQLYALSGRRSRALGHYQELQRHLRRDLGVDPAEETQALARQIESEELPAQVAARDGQSRGPVVPFVGREAAMAQLAAAWSAVQGGAGRLTLVEGPSGIGKTRLVRTFLDGATSGTPATVLLGAGFEGDPPVPYRPLAEALGNAVATDPDTADQILVASGQKALQILAPLVTELAAVDPRLQTRLERERPEALPETLALALSRVLGSLGQRGGKDRPVRPVILFLDDLQAADSATLQLLELLPRTVAELPCWIVGTYRAEPLPRGHPLRRLSAQVGRQRVSSIELGALDRESLEHVAETLLGERHPAFATALHQGSGGHPHKAAELVNLLADEQLLTPLADRRWSVAGDPKDLDRYAGLSLDEVVRERLRSLPPTSRRLLSLAAVVGQVFAPEVLQEVEGEHGEVVEIALEILTDRWFVRPFPRYWADSRRERFKALAGEGARTALFEFTHPSLRALVYRSLPKERVRFLHKKVADSLESRCGGGVEGPVELLAHHFRLAGQHRQAADYALAASERAQRLGAEEIALTYRRNADEALRRLAR